MVAEKTELIEMTAEIVSAYAGYNKVAPEELSGLIHRVFGTLAQISVGGAPAAGSPPEPAVPIRKSVTPDYLICLEDGQKFKSLKRHLRAHYDLSPEQYREKWGLPRDYPMVAPNYAQARSKLAKKMGLGQGGRGRAK
jgi:predicted transcriptional regulator